MPLREKIRRYVKRQIGKIYCILYYAFHYKIVLHKLNKKVSSGKKIKVGFICVYASAFACREIVHIMEKSDIFIPYVIIAPDVLRGKENLVLHYNLHGA